jgi:cation transport regulator ChaC
MSQASWLFGYGSLIWRPDIPYLETQPASLRGYVRRFWQGSHDHRGVPDKPGRVVTLIEQADALCTGKAFLVDAEVVRATFERLDHREKNGYQRHSVTLDLADRRQVDGLVYIAPQDNFAFLGEASLEEIAAQIARSHGPSGANTDYLFELANALRQLDVHDEHVFALESLVRNLQLANQRGHILQ